MSSKPSEQTQITKKSPPTAESILKQNLPNEARAEVGILKTHITTQDDLKKDQDFTWKPADKEPVEKNLDKRPLSVQEVDNKSKSINKLSTKQTSMDENIFDALLNPEQITYS